jgi:uncharacterized protein (TIRG00374 family)
MAAALRVLVAALVTVGCLYFALRGTQWAEVRHVLAGTNLGWVAMMMLVSVIVVYVRALRWRVLLSGVARLPVRPLFTATAVGFMSNMLLPLRAGEIIRPVLLGRQTGVPKTAAFASVLLERLFDLLLIFLFLLGIGVAVPVPAWMGRASYMVAGGILGIVVLLFLLLRYRERAVAAIRGALGRLPGNAGHAVSSVVDSFLGGVSSINDGRTVIALLGYSFAVWAIIACTFGLGLLALDLQVPLAAGSVILMIVIAAFVSLPQAPGFVGTWQAGCVFALAFYGVSKEQAIGYSLMTHVVQVVVNVLLGVVCLLADHVGFRELVALAGDEQRGRE